MFTSGVGIAAGADTAETTKKAISDAQQSLGDTPAKLALIFASSHFDQSLVYSTARATLSEEVIIFGGSTAGEISHHGPSMSPSIVVMLLGSGDDVIFSETSINDANNDGEAKGALLGNELARLMREDTKLALMLGDGLTVNPSAVLRGIARVVPELPIAGGSAGDDGKYKQTFQYTKAGVVSSSVQMVTLSGALKYAVGVRHGWNAISGPKKVTKAAGTVIHEIDNKPAIALYEEYIGAEHAATLKEKTLATLALSYPLGVKDSSSGEMLLRAPFYVDAAGAITCGGEVLEGTEVQLMMGTKESAVEAARHSAEQALAALGTTPKAAIIFSCHVRDTLYASREQSKKEIDAIQEVIGQNVPLAGFYTYAEQAPINDANYNIKMCNNVNHNETIVIVLLGE